MAGLVNKSIENQAGKIRSFESGATRDIDTNKYDYEGFLSPIVLERYAQYMHKHRLQSDGSLRESDNWQKGIPIKVYMKSLLRHVHDLWKQHRGYRGQDVLLDSLSAILFNTMGYMHEVLSGRGAPSHDIKPVYEAGTCLECSDERAMMETLSEPQGTTGFAQDDDERLWQNVNKGLERR